MLQAGLHLISWCCVDIKDQQGMGTTYTLDYCFGSSTKKQILTLRSGAHILDKFSIHNSATLSQYFQDRVQELHLTSCMWSSVPDGICISLCLLRRRLHSGHAYAVERAHGSHERPRQATHIRIVEMVHLGLCVGCTLTTVLTLPIDNTCPDALDISAPAEYELMAED